MNPKELSKESSSGHEREDEWSEVTRGERYIIRATSEEANGAYSVLEVVANPRNGVPMHVHDNEEEHFIILGG
jgi:quercetin dioxygenase-like cupin family protein